VQRKLEIVPLELAEANEQVDRWHRHHTPAVGHRFSIGVEAVDVDGRVLVGAAIVGRPVARMNDDGWTLEVTRVATDGTPNACSALYGAAWRVCREMGYRRLITYTLATEPGTSLRAAGWTEIGKRGGGSWDRPSRRRTDKAPTCQKTLFEKRAEES
jgi:hypothetical protein